jgi:phosphoribosylformimino-5-aminoimidazole carboxamide ribotide isomerase
VIAIPAVDLREQACVQLVGGSYAAERVRLPDPLAVATRWREIGFSRLHVVDLDAATGVGSNRDIVLRLLEDRAVEVQVGGGVRSDDDVASLLDCGAAWVVVGTRAIEEPSWLERMAARFPGRLIVAADMRSSEVVVHGWSRRASEGLEALLDRLRALPLAGLLVTAVDVEGQMCGPDLSLMERVRAGSSLPLIASGGIGSMQDLYDLRARNAVAAVIGMALYDGVLDALEVAREFGR